MKYIITESNLEKVIMKYIEDIPELQNLEQFDCSAFDWDMGVNFEEICFQENDYDTPVISYYPYPEVLNSPKKKEYGEELNYLPALKLDTELANTLYSLFEGRWKKPFKEWFKSKYNLKIKTFYD
jgi:hypothetical protein